MSDKLRTPTTYIPRSITTRARQRWTIWALVWMVGVLLLTYLLGADALATDLFSAGKQTIKDTAGTGSAVENAILASGAIGALSAGFMTRNWMGAVGGFIGGMIFWEVVKPLVGLS